MGDNVESPPRAVTDGSNFISGLAPVAPTVKLQLDDVITTFTVEDISTFLSYENPPATIMRLSFGLLLPAIAGIAQAASESVEGFIFTASKPRYPETLTLTPEQVRLVLAQQLDITQYHSLGSSEALEFVNKLGGSQQKLFDDNAIGTPSPRRLVVFLDSSPASTTASNLKAEWNTRGWEGPSFGMPESAGSTSAEVLVGDMQKQIAAPELPSQQCALAKVINDSADECWHGKNSQILQIAENSVSMLFLPFTISTNPDLSPTLLHSSRTKTPYSTQSTAASSKPHLSSWHSHKVPTANTQMRPGDSTTCRPRPLRIKSAKPKP